MKSTNDEFMYRSASNKKKMYRRMVNTISIGHKHGENMTV